MLSLPNHHYGSTLPPRAQVIDINGEHIGEFISDVRLFIRAHLGLVILGFMYLALVSHVVKNRYFHPLSNFPGPFWGSITNLYCSLMILTGESQKTEFDFHKKYGPVVRIAPNLLLVSDPKMLPVIYQRKADKTDFYITGTLGKGAESVFNTRAHHDHYRLRKKLAGAYHLRATKGMETLVGERILEWTAKLGRTFADTGDMLDLSMWSQYLAYDVITELGFGEAMGFVRQGQDVGGLIKCFHYALPPIGSLARLPNLTKMVVGWDWVTAKPTDKYGLGPVMAFRDRCIEQRLAAGSNSRQDLLQNLLDQRTTDGQHAMSVDQIKAETLIVLLAGSDTPASAFRACVLYTLTTPGVYEKLMDEINTAVDQNELSSPVVTFDEAKRLRYFSACLREAMRLSPSAPVLLPRLVPEGGTMLCGQYVPEGAEIAANPWVIHRSKELYGEDAEEYRPERWLESEEKTKEMDKYDFQFGYGDRSCLGKSIALMELYKGLVQFFRLFEPELVNPKKPCVYRNMGIAVHTNFWIRVKNKGIDSA
ncbi:putative cytochrome P450 monooxygenase [Tirmania nivea]|nr:putative cytochrome P450 monooxygenase [Tirmania nivea]